MSLPQECQADERGLPLKRSHSRHPPRSRHREIETSVTIDDDLEKKVSPLWLFACLPFLTLAISSLVAPRMEIYTILVCRKLRPEYSEHTSQNCAADPVVQAGLSKLVAVITMSTGLIGCMTTSWWGSFSDRHGRKYALAISVFGIIFFNLNVVLVSKFNASLPGHYWFLLVGSVLEGLLGGGTVIAGVEAYIVDCTDASSRSRTLSIVTGVLAVGGTLGPTLGGVLIHASQRVLLVFYVGIVVLLCYMVSVLTVIPESLSKEQMLVNRSAYARQRSSGSVLATVLAPLTMFAPTTFETADGQLKTDWNLTLIGIVYGLFSVFLGPADYMLQYTSYVFAWTSEFISYWIAATGMTRTIFCLLIFPVTIAWLKRKSPVTGLPLEVAEPLLAPPLSDADNEAFRRPTLEEASSSSFDLSVARVSLMFYVGSYAIMGMASSPWVFAAASLLAQFGSGYLPCLHSLAMGMFVLKGRRVKGEGEGGLIPTETGKLYSSLAVIQGFCSIALGPALFALIFMTTVSFFPAAVFMFIVVGMSASFYLLSLVQLPKGSTNVAARCD